MQLIEIWLSSSPNQIKHKHDQAIVALQKFCDEHQINMPHIDEKNGTAQFTVDNAALNTLKTVNFIDQLPVPGNHPAIFICENESIAAANNDIHFENMSCGLTA